MSFDLMLSTFPCKAMQCNGSYQLMTLVGYWSGGGGYKKKIIISHWLGMCETEMSSVKLMSEINFP